MPRVTSVQAAVMGGVLAVVDRAAPVVPVDTDHDPPAEVRDDAIILRCGGSYMYSTLEFQCLESPTPEVPVWAGDQPEHVTLDWTIASGDLVVDQLHRGALPVSDVGLGPGRWAVAVYVWGREEAAQLEDRMNEEDEEDPDADPFPVGPERWLLRFWRKA